MTEYVRYDLYYTGNKHTGGILSKLNDTGIYSNMNVDEDEFCRVLMKFNYELEVPNYYELGDNNVAFFTPEGYTYFKPYLLQLAAMIKEHCHGWEARETRARIDEEGVLYRDEYQIIVSTEGEYIL